MLFNVNYTNFAKSEFLKKLCVFFEIFSDWSFHQSEKLKKKTKLFWKERIVHTNWMNQNIFVFEIKD